MKVFIYSNTPQSGKSVVSAVFVENGFNRLSFAEPVKQSLLVVLEALGVENPHEYLWGDLKDAVVPELGVTGGFLMSHYATTFFRDMINKDVWVNIAKRDLKDSLVCDDLRFPNELDIADITIKVVRPNAAKNTRSSNSEGQLDDVRFDYVIVNDGTLEQLRNKALQIVHEIGHLTKIAKII